MTSTSQDFTLYQGEAKQLLFTISGLATVAGLSAEWVLWGSGVAQVTKTSALGAITFADLGDTISATVDLDSEDSESVAAGQYTHQLTLVDADEDRGVVAEGVVTVKARRTAL